MRALAFDQSHSFRPRQPDLAEADRDTLRRVRRAGVCATDLEIVKGYMGFRGVLGHRASSIFSPIDGVPHNVQPWALQKFTKNPALIGSDEEMKAMVDQIQSERRRSRFQF